MYRIGLAVLGFVLLACSGTDDQQAAKGSGVNDSGPAFNRRFAAAKLPYQLTDTALLNNRDTATLPATDVSALVPDTTEEKIFGRVKGVKYSPLAKVDRPGKESYYVVKGTAGGKKAALLMVFDQSGNYGTTIPFLVPDNKAGTTQMSSIDAAYTITRAVTQRSDGVVSGEGKEVLAWDPAERNISLVMTDLLNENHAVLVNPLDTFAKTHRLSGDYYRNDKNLIAVRDGRYPNQILVYIHTENSDRDCIGELKGEFILTSSTTAVYRQGGDPCILELTFSGSSVSMNEQRGCGNYRGLDCPLSGTFTRKKEGKIKKSQRKSAPSKQS